MRRGLFIIAVGILASCRGAAPVSAPIVVKSAAPPPESNVIVTLSEAVAGPDDDISAYAKVFVDGKEAGRTGIGPKSAVKAWGSVLSSENHLFRFEVWMLPVPGEWTPLASQWQPPERFIRLEPGGRARAALKLYDGGRRHSLQIDREPLSAPVFP